MINYYHTQEEYSTVVRPICKKAQSLISSRWDGTIWTDSGPTFACAYNFVDTLLKLDLA